MKKQIHMDVFAGAVLIIASIAIAIISKDFPEAPKRFPMLICALNALIGVLIMGRGIKYSKEGADIELPIKWNSFKYVLVGTIAIIVYAWAMPRIHFFPATLIFIPLIMIFMRVRDWKKIVLIDLGVNGFLYLMFVIGLKAQLP